YQAKMAPSRSVTAQLLRGPALSRSFAPCEPTLDTIPAVPERVRKSPSSAENRRTGRVVPARTSADDATAYQPDGTGVVVGVDMSRRLPNPRTSSPKGSVRFR